MYSCVYKCVCKQHAERLYEDLMSHVRAILTEWYAQLTSPTMAANPLAFIVEFDRVVSQYLHATSSIVPIFTYMVRVPSLLVAIECDQFLMLF